MQCGTAGMAQVDEMYEWFEQRRSPFSPLAAFVIGHSADGLPITYIEPAEFDGVSFVQKRPASVSKLFLPPSQRIF